MKKNLQIVLILMCAVLLNSGSAYAQLASDKVPGIAARRVRKSLVITRTVNHERLTASNKNRLSSNSVSPVYVQSKLPVSMRTESLSSQQLLRSTRPVELPSNSPTLAQRGIITRKPPRPAVY